MSIGSKHQREKEAVAFPERKIKNRVDRDPFQSPLGVVRFWRTFPAVDPKDETKPVFPTLAKARPARSFLGIESRNIQFPPLRGFPVSCRRPRLPRLQAFLPGRCICQNGHPPACDCDGRGARACHRETAHSQESQELGYRARIASKTRRSKLEIRKPEDPNLRKPILPRLPLTLSTGRLCHHPCAPNGASPFVWTRDGENHADPNDVFAAGLDDRFKLVGLLLVLRQVVPRVPAPAAASGLCSGVCGALLSYPRMSPANACCTPAPACGPACAPLAELLDDA